MTVIGITGPSGAGKGELSRFLNEKYGFPILDADVIYHSLVSSPSPCLEEIKAEFGEKVIAPNGSLDRKALSDLVFGENNRDRLNLLNQITHKHVVSEIDNSLLKFRDSVKACIIDAPLLIEAGLCSKCDLTVSVLASQETRAERISKRDGIDQASALRRIRSQKEDEYYILHTSHTIVNDGDISLLRDAADKIMREEGIID